MICCQNARLNKEQVKHTDFNGALHLHALCHTCINLWNQAVIATGICTVCKKKIKATCISGANLQFEEDDFKKKEAAASISYKKPYTISDKLNYSHRQDGFADFTTSNHRIIISKIKKPTILMNYSQNSLSDFVYEGRNFRFTENSPENSPVATKEAPKIAVYRANQNMGSCSLKPSEKK